MFIHQLFGHDTKLVMLTLPQARASQQAMTDHLRAGSSSDTLRDGPMLALPRLEHLKQVAHNNLAAAAAGSLAAYHHQHVFHAGHELRVPSGKQSLTSIVCCFLVVYVLTALQSSIECQCFPARPSPNHLVFDYIQCVMTMLQRPA